MRWNFKESIHLILFEHLFVQNKPLREGALLTAGTFRQKDVRGAKRGNSRGSRVSLKRKLVERHVLLLNVKSRSCDLRTFMSVTGHAEPLWGRKHSFSGNTAFTALSFYVPPRSHRELLYFTTCNAKAYDRYATRAVFHRRHRLRTAIYLFRDTVFALARRNIARELRRKAVSRARVFRNAFRRSPPGGGSFVSSRERRIPDFEARARRNSSREFPLFAEESAVAENKERLKRHTYARRYYYVAGIKLRTKTLVLARRIKTSRKRIEIILNCGIIITGHGDSVKIMH